MSGLHVATILLASGLMSCKGSKSKQPPTAQLTDVSAVARAFDAGAPGSEGPPNPTVVIDLSPSDAGRTDASAPLTAGPPTATGQADLDRDGTNETISIWCNPEDDQEEEGRLVVKVGNATAEFETELSDLMGCNFEVTKPKRGTRLLWVVAEEHEEAGQGRYFLLQYKGGELELLWKKSAEISRGDDNSWSTEDWYCDAEAKKQTTSTTKYRFAGGKVKKKTTSKSAKIDPADCESSDP